MDGMCALDVLIFGKNYEKVRLKTLSKEINSLSFIFFLERNLKTCVQHQLLYPPEFFLNGLDLERT